MDNQITFFAETTFRNQRRRFGIKTDDRRRHMYIVGKTGMGKTVMMENMAIQDIQNGHGVGFVDPHGEAAERLLDFVPSSRIDDVIYFDPSDLDYPMAFNIMEKVDVKHRHLVSAGLMGVFKKIWPDVWSARMEYILNYCILALLEYPNSTLLGVNRMLADADYREKVIEKVTDPVVKAFWIQEFSRYTQRYEVEATAAIQNKIGQFISSPLIRNIIGQVRTSINMREVMDKEKILILNLSKGKIGEDASRLLGALLITKLQLAAMSRVDIPESERKDFYLYVDEFQNFATESFINILSEARKYRLVLTLGHQYIAQMEEEGVKEAVFGNVGTIVSFRVGAEDAEFLGKEFTPEFTPQDLANLPKYNIYLKLMINGVASRPFSAETFPPEPLPEKSYKKEIIEACRRRYGTPRAVIEEKVSRWLGEVRPSSVTQESAPILYDAKCSLCGKATKVIFPPDGKRPVYCKSCLKKIQREKGEDGEFVSLEEAVEKEPIPFSIKKKKEEKPKPKRKTVNMERLKDILKESLNIKKEESEEREENNSKDKNHNKIKKGILKPGETVKF